MAGLRGNKTAAATIRLLTCDAELERRIAGETQRPESSGRRERELDQLERRERVQVIRIGHDHVTNENHRSVRFAPTHRGCKGIEVVPRKHRRLARIGRNATAEQDTAIPPDTSRVVEKRVQETKRKREFCFSGSQLQKHRREVLADAVHACLGMAHDNGGVPARRCKKRWDIVHVCRGKFIGLFTRTPVLARGTRHPRGTADRAGYPCR